ncbi:MAG TPA: hypothetical protein PLD25_08640 [Chloroflexota bacterium]|nr:hypothetical protein [Chloroflexota bacterium]HUM69118.1 hypothetical protein [Chloroflexota bacterium]
MTTVTINLPDQLANELEKLQISEEVVQSVALAALEIWLSQPNIETVPKSSTKRFEESAMPFVQDLIAKNRALFEVLAQR